MSKKKFYAVINAKEGKYKIYESCEICKKNLKGEKGSPTIFKSFLTKDEAINFLFNEKTINRDNSDNSSKEKMCIRDRYVFVRGYCSFFLLYM